MIHRHLTLIPAFCFVFLLTAFCLLPTALAQTATATLSGTVVDQNGAVVAGVAITVINPATSLERSATTSDSGSFTIPLIPPGTYTLTAKRDGFKIIRAENIVLNVNDERALQINLQVGDVNEVVDVTGETPLIDESASVGTVVDRQFVANLPLNGRSFQSLITLSPGVILTKAASDNPGQFSVNGQRADANYFTVDGVSANIGVSTLNTVSQSAAGAVPGFNATGGTSNLVSVDALEEFKILTSTFAPEFGRTPGGQIALLTRSGGKEFHGNLFDYVRNEKMDANDFFTNRAGQKRPPLRQNDYGVTLSGPVVLPRFGEGPSRLVRMTRTFFFFSFEGLRLQLPQTSTTSVPSLATRQNAPARMQPFLNAYPIPNGAISSNGTALFTGSYSNPSKLDATSLRIDHSFGSRWSIFSRLNNAPSSNVVRSTSELSNPIATKVDMRTFTGGVTMVINPSVSNELRINWSRARGESSSSLDNFGGAVPVPDSLLFPPFSSSQTGLVVFALLFGTPIPNWSVGHSVVNFQRQINVVNNLSLLTGSHQLKFGIDYRRLTPIYGPNSYNQSAFFASVTAINAGLVSTGSAVSAIQGGRPIYTNSSAFGQDTWRVSRQATVTYGLRWEVNPPPSAGSGKQPRTVNGLDNPATATLAPEGTPLWNTKYANFAPRFGLAYQLSQKSGRETVLRGGVGIFYDMGNAQGSSGFINFPFTVRKALSNVPFPLSLADATPPAFTVTLPASSGIYAFDPNLDLPRTYQWNLAIEQSLGATQTITAAYIGAAGRRLLQVDQIRPPLVNPALTSSVIFFTRNRGTSDYHAMQLQFQRRLSRGLQALLSYTWAHSIDTASTDLSDLGRARGSSDFDVRHAFTGGATYNLPAPSKNKILGFVLRNWSIDSILRTQSATPVNIIARSGSLNLDGTSINVRPDLVVGVPLYLKDPTAPGGKRFNPAAFALPPTGPGSAFLPLRQGTLGRNALRGFPLNQIDFSLRRRFDLTERLNMLVRADVFNIFNHPNFADPNNVLFSSVNASGGVANPNFGLSQTMLGRSLFSSLGAGFNPLYQVGGPRSIQLSLKFGF